MRRKGCCVPGCPPELGPLCYHTPGLAMRVMVASTPCRRQGPRPIRDDGAGLCGPADLLQRDAEKVRLGNKQARLAFAILRAAMATGGTWTLDNPQTSRFFLTREFCRMSKLGGRRAITHFCQWGKPWRKATTCLFWSAGRIYLQPYLRVCQRVGNLRSASLMPHQILAGVDPAGKQFWTQAARPYPASA